MILEKLKSLETESIGRGIPIIGSGKGRFLYEKVLEAKPKKVLELGTANGYSGIILGYLGAKLTTIDVPSTQYITFLAPHLSDTHPPKALITPEGKLNNAAKMPAVTRDAAYTLTK